MNKIVEIYREKDRLVVEIGAMPSWEGFDELIDFLVEEYNALVVKNMDGAFERLCILTVNGHEFKLCYDDRFGNRLFAATKESEKVVLQIAQDIETWLMGKVLSLGDGLEVRISGDESAFLTFWNAKGDVTGTIYQQLKNKPYFESLILGGAPYLYDLMEAPLEHLDALLEDVKALDKTALKAD